VERLAGLARLDPGAARHRADIEGVAADRATGIGPGAAARHVEGSGIRPPCRSVAGAGGTACGGRLAMTALSA
jgi:hypothetical protein